MFWTEWRLDSIETKVYTGGAYHDVDTYALNQIYPATGDNLDPALYLGKVTHTGLVGGELAEPTVYFNGQYHPNRVDYGSDIGVEPMNKYRIYEVVSDTGSKTEVSYMNTECTRDMLNAGQVDPDNNSRRCFPQYITVGTSLNDTGWGWFHKYLVASVTAKDLTGGGPDEVWAYSYTMDGSSTDVLWHYDTNYFVPAARRSWTDWRGYTTVQVWHGYGSPVTYTTYRYFRGMNGDRTDAGDGTRTATVTDSQETTQTDFHYLRGFLREQVAYRNDVSPAVPIQSTINNPWGLYTAQQQVFGNFYATIVRTWDTDTRTYIAGSNTWRVRHVHYDRDGHGLTVDFYDGGDTAVTGDETCTHTDYTQDTANWLIDFPYQVVTTDCASTLGDGDYLAGSQVYYDDHLGLTDLPSRGLATTTNALAGVAGGAMTWKQASRAGYDSSGRAISSFDALDRQTTTLYTPTVGGPVTQVQVTNPMGFVTTTTLDPYRGQPTLVTDPNGKTTNARYDPLGRLTQVWLNNRQPDTTTPDLQYTYTLQAGAPNWISTTRLGPTGNPITSYTFYDGRLRPRQTQSPAPDSLGGRVITDTSYNALGLPAQTATFWNSTAPGSTMVGYADTDVANEHRYSYDTLGRQTADALYSGDGQGASTLKWQTTTAYDGDRTTVTPPAGGTPTTTLVNAQGKTIELRQYTDGTTSGPYQSTTYTYDLLQRLKTVTDPVGNHWDTTYDLRGRVSQKTDPDAGTMTLSYDDAGELLTSTDGRRDTDPTHASLAYSYDDLGRKTAMYQGTDTTGTLLAKWNWDPIGYKGQLANTKRYDSAGNAYTTAVTGYDDAYRPLGTTVTIPTAQGSLAGDYTTSMTYNVDGSIATMQYPTTADMPDPETVTFGYDSVGLPKTETSSLPDVTYMSGVDYYYWGSPNHTYLGKAGSRVKLTDSIDEATGRTTSLKTETEIPGAPDTWTDQLTQTYTWDPAGNITSINDVTGGTENSNQCFGYDGLRQLTEAWTTTATTCQTTPSIGIVGGPDPYWTSYRYNSIGNRTSDTQHTTAGDTTRDFTYPTGINNQPHTLTGIAVAGTTTDTYGYDKAGNTTTRDRAGQPNQGLTWDAEGHLASVTDTGGTTSYLYTADGGRLLATNPDSSVTLYLGTTEITRGAMGSITSTRYYTVGGGTVASRTVSGGLVWQAGDHQGTAQLAIKATDLSVTRRKHDPYGNPRGTQPLWPNPHGFVGGTTDPTGLTHLGAREYDPAIGRFISIDHVLDNGDPVSMNGYTYADGSPVTGSDPSGLWTDHDPTDQDPSGACSSDATCSLEMDQEAAARAQGAAASEVATITGPLKGHSNDRLLTTKDGSEYYLNDREMNADEKSTMNYLNDSLKAQGIYNDGDGTGQQYQAVLQDPKSGRMPDMVRITWEDGHIVDVTRVDIVTRTVSNPSGAVKRLLDKAGQSGKPRQADEVVIRLDQIPGSSDEANAILEQAKAAGVKLNAIRFVDLNTSDTTKAFDWTYNLKTDIREGHDMGGIYDICGPGCIGKPAGPDDWIPGGGARITPEVPEEDPFIDPFIP